MLISRSRETVMIVCQSTCSLNQLFMSVSRRAASSLLGQQRTGPGLIPYQFSVEVPPDAHSRDRGGQGAAEPRVFHEGADRNSRMIHGREADKPCVVLPVGILRRPRFSRDADTRYLRRSPRPPLFVDAPVQDRKSTRLNSSH